MKDSDWSWFLILYILLAPIFILFDLVKLQK